MKIKFLLLISLMPLFLMAQDYEQQGDELFAQAQYEKAIKKYDAAIVSLEMEEQVPSAQLKQKKDTAKKCASLLQKAVFTEGNKQYIEAERAYSELYALHAFPDYQKKIAECKCILQKEARAQKEREKNYVNGHLVVDMGLSVRWADCNIGAGAPDEAGNYYAWGETNTKVSFPWNTYKHISNGKLIKYCTNSSSGRVDNKRILETQDDAAYVNWGSAWRIPTKEQWEELADNNKCIWEWTTDNGVYGYKVTSKITGNSIFLPTTGYKPGGTRIEHPELGLYWTSTLFTGQYDNGYLAAYRFDLGQTHYNCRGTHRCNGRAIRAVCR